MPRSDDDDDLEYEDQKHQPHPSTDPKTPSRSAHDSSQNDDDQRDAALRRELEGVRNINSVITGVIASLETARSNMSTVSHTVGSASTLLETWTRILSQTEHNQRLVLDPNWQGASRDWIDMENEATMRVQAEQRRRAEEDRRREEAKRKLEDEERARQAGTTTPSTRGRGRGRVGIGRGRGAPSTRGATSYVGVGGQGGRGIPPPRVRGPRARGT